MVDEEYEEDHTAHCWCEDPYNVGHKLRLCGQAICLRLNGHKPQPMLIIDKIFGVFDEET